MCDKEYNGWRNYETWYINLVIGDNEEVLTDMVEEAASFVHELADILKSYINEYIEDVEGVDPYGNTPAATAVRLMIDAVDWSELAENYIHDYGTEEEEESDDR